MEKINDLKNFSSCVEEFETKYSAKNIVEFIRIVAKNWYLSFQLDYHDNVYKKLMTITSTSPIKQILYDVYILLLELTHSKIKNKQNWINPIHPDFSSLIDQEIFKRISQDFKNKSSNYLRLKQEKEYEEVINLIKQLFLNNYCRETLRQLWIRILTQTHNVLKLPELSGNNPDFQSMFPLDNFVIITKETFNNIKNEAKKRGDMDKRILISLVGIGIVILATGTIYVTKTPSEQKQSKSTRTNNNRKLNSNRDNSSIQTENICTDKPKILVLILKPNNQELIDSLKNNKNISSKIAIALYQETRYLLTVA